MLFLPSCLLLFGPASHKTLAVEAWSERVGRPLARIHLTSETEVTDIIGCMQPCDEKDALGQCARAVRFLRNWLCFRIGLREVVPLAGPAATRNRRVAAYVSGSPRKARESWQRPNAFNSVTRCSWPSPEPY